MGFGLSAGLDPLEREAEADEAVSELVLLSNDSWDTNLELVDGSSIGEVDTSSLPLLKLTLLSLGLLCSPTSGSGAVEVEAVLTPISRSNRSKLTKELT